MNVLYLFGPNLGTLGRRDPETYGSQTIPEIMSDLDERAREHGHTLRWHQSDHEGELIGWLLAAREERVEFVVLNPGALSHYSAPPRRDRGLGAARVEVHVQHLRP
jgi:3-dehydroquinate dehydratase-2